MNKIKINFNYFEITSGFTDEFRIAVRFSFNKHDNIIIKF